MGAADHHVDVGLGALIILGVHVVTAVGLLQVHVDGRIHIGAGSHVIAVHTTNQVVYVGSGHVALNHTELIGHADLGVCNHAALNHGGLGIHGRLGIHRLLTGDVLGDPAVLHLGVAVVLANDTIHGDGVAGHGLNLQSVVAAGAVGAVGAVDGQGVAGLVSQIHVTPLGVVHLGDLTGNVVLLLGEGVVLHSGTHSDGFLDGQHVVILNGRLGIHRGIGIHGLIGRRHGAATQVHVPAVQVLLQQTVVTDVDGAVAGGIGGRHVGSHIPAVQILLEQTQVADVDIAVIVDITGGEINHSDRTVNGSKGHGLKLSVEDVRRVNQSDGHGVGAGGRILSHLEGDESNSAIIGDVGMDRVHPHNGQRGSQRAEGSALEVRLHHSGGGQNRGVVANSDTHSHDAGVILNADSHVNGATGHGRHIVHHKGRRVLVGANAYAQNRYQHEQCQYHCQYFFHIRSPP